MLLAAPVKADWGAVQWLERLGFHDTLRVLILRLEVRGDRAGRVWDAPVAPGYRLVEWSTEAPEELIASYAAARQAIADAPMGARPLREGPRTRDQGRHAAHAA